MRKSWARAPLTSEGLLLQRVAQSLLTSPGNLTVDATAMGPTAALERLRSLKGKVEVVTFKLLFKVRGGPTPAASSSLLLLLLWQHAYAPCSANHDSCLPISATAHMPAVALSPHRSLTISPSSALNPC